MSFKTISWQEIGTQIRPIARDKRWYLMGPATNNDSAKQPYTFIKDRLLPASGWSNLDNAVDFETVLESHSYVNNFDERAYFQAYKTGLVRKGLIQVTLDFDDHKSQKKPLLVENRSQLTSFAKELIEAINSSYQNAKKPPLVILSKGGKGFHIPLWISSKSNIPPKIEIPHPRIASTTIVVEFLKSGLAILNNVIIHSGEMPTLDLKTLLKQLGVGSLRQRSRKRRSKRKIKDLDWFTEQELRSALSAIPSDDYDIWIKIGLALKPHGEKGFLLFRNWSSTSAKYQGEDEIREKWETFKPEEITIGSIFYLAKEKGWKSELPQNLKDYLRRY